MKYARILAVLVASGCAVINPPGYRFSRTTQASSSAKPDNCSFDLLSMRPDRAFDEIGVVDYSHGGYVHDADRAAPRVPHPDRRTAGDVRRSQGRRHI